MEEAALHASLSEYLQGMIDDVEGMDPRELRQRLATHVEWEHGNLTLTPPNRPRWLGAYATWHTLSGYH